MTGFYVVWYSTASVILDYQSESSVHLFKGKCKQKKLVKCSSFRIPYYREFPHQGVKKKEGEGGRGRERTESWRTDRDKP